MKNCLVILLLLALSSSDATRRKRADDVSYDALVTLVQQQGSVIEDLQARLGASDAKVNGLTSEMNRVKSQMEAINQTVAFTVQFSSSPVTNIGSHAIFHFDHVITNIGNGYSTATGIFSAPVAGVYLFFFRMMSYNGGSSILAAIDKHGEVLGWVWGDGQGDSNDQGSVLVTTHLDAGEDVWVRQYSGADAVYGSYYTVFSGSLVKAD